MAGSALPESFLGKNLNERLRDYLEQAGLEWDPARTLYLSLIFGVADSISFGTSFHVVARSRSSARWLESHFLSLSLTASDRPGWRSLKNSFRMRWSSSRAPCVPATHSPYRSRCCTRSMPRLSPTSFGRVFEEQNLGLPLEVALERLGTRVPLLDVKFFVSSVLLQKRTGGNLAALLENLSYLIRERFKLRGRIRSISAHGRISGLVLSMIPLGVLRNDVLDKPRIRLIFLWTTQTEKC